MCDCGARAQEYLNQKKIEGSLARTQQYLQAVKVKEAADELYAAEVVQTQQQYEAEQKLRIAKFNTKQKQEFEALLQRGARGRDELELRRIAETERRMFRFRNVIAVRPRLAGWCRRRIVEAVGWGSSRDRVHAVIVPLCVNSGAGELAPARDCAAGGVPRRASPGRQGGAAQGRRSLPPEA